MITTWFFSMMDVMGVTSVTLNDSLTTTTLLGSEEDLSANDVIGALLEETGNTLEWQWDVAYLAMSLIWLILGVPGNLLVLLSIVSYKELRSVLRWLMLTADQFYLKNQIYSSD